MAFEDEKLRISCKCEGEEIALNYSPDSCDPSIDLSFWSVGRERYGSPLTYKLKQIIELLRTGDPYSDMVILNSKEAMKLGKKLVELAPELAKAEKAQLAKNKKLAREHARKQKEKAE